MFRMFGVAPPGGGMSEGLTGSAAVPLPMMGRITRIRSYELRGLTGGCAWTVPTRAKRHTRTATARITPSMVYSSRVLKAFARFLFGNQNKTSSEAKKSKGAPITSYQPPATSNHPPATSHQQPATSNQRDNKSAMHRALLLLALAASTAWAHIGSPDVFFEGSAGPYPLFVTIRPPSVIPGVAQIEIRCPSADLRKLLITPIPLVGEASQHPPTPDIMAPSKYDPQFFTGSLWIMETGSSQIRIQASGARGPGRFLVPVAAVANRTKTMNLALRGVLLALMLTLVIGIVSIAGAGVREAQLEPGAKVPPEFRRRARIVMAATAVFLAAILYLGNLWWSEEASDYSRYLYKPLQMTPVLDRSQLILNLSDPGWLTSRKLDDFVPDHNHLMHLYMIHWPEMDHVWHLHPEMIATGRFRQQVQDLPRGNYKLYADVVHADGFPETLAADFSIHMDGKIRGQRFRKAIGMDHVGIQLVIAARQVRQLLAEAPGGNHFRMKVPNMVHFRPVDHI